MSNHPVKVRNTELLSTDTRERYREKIARITLDSMVQFVGLLDADGTVLEINKVALDAVGITLADVEGKPFWTTFWWQVSPAINAELREMIRGAAGGEFMRWDTEIYGRAGGKETIIIDASLMPVKDEHGNVVFIAAEGRDITAKKAYEREIARQREELAELDRLKTKFFANISHEFRTPLTLMLGPLEDALADAELSSANRERLRLAHRNALRQLKLVNTLLDFSRIEAGRIEASYEPTDLAALTAELASVFRSAIERAGMQLVVECTPQPEPVWVDREMWEKIVLNLLSNAFKFTFEGTITVTLRHADNTVELAVSDTGTGIPTEELPRLFERFHRVKHARGRSYEGSGIGLALVQELVKLHGGSVRIRTELDRGSTFTIAIPLGTAHLPVDRLNAARTLASTGLRGEAYVAEVLRWLPDDAGRGLTSAETVESPVYQAPRRVDGGYTTKPAKILLADDNADMRDYVRRLLIQSGYEVEAVADGSAALAAIHDHHPDLVLTDVMMPGVDGFGLLRALRADEQLKTLPVILLSARAGEESRVEGLHAGADDYLVKPFSARELLARVESHVRLQQVRRDANQAVAEAQDRLRQVAKMEAIGRLAGGLAHDFNNQLHAVSGFVNFVLRDAGMAEQSRHDLLEVQKAADRMASLTRQLLAFSRQQVLRLETLELNHAVRDSYSLLQRLLGAHIQVTLSVPATPLWVRVDRSQLLQVLMNLAINARDAMPDGGQLVLHTEARGVETETFNPTAGATITAGAYAVLTVTDSGVGIAPEDLPRIFEPFFTTKDVGQGTGLGLATVLGIVTQSHGHVWAENAADGGARFTVLLPLANELVSVPAGHHARGSDDSQPARILVVDDEDQVRTIVARALEDCGHTVLQAYDGRDALDQLAKAEGAVDAVLTDVVMPVMGGVELAKQLSVIWPHLPIIWMSGYSRDAASDDGLLRDNQPFLQKPVSGEILAKTLDEVLRSRTSR